MRTVAKRLRLRGKRPTELAEARLLGQQCEIRLCRRKRGQMAKKIGRKGINGGGRMRAWRNELEWKIEYECIA
jgi:hypothetical protein